MKINIQRDKQIVSYQIELLNATALEILDYIKTTIDSSLTFSSGCRSGVCGSCTIIVNDTEVLACAYKLKDNDLIKPLKNMPIVRDLVVNMDKAFNFNKIAKAWGLPKIKALHVSIEDAFRYELQSDCILCSACFSACPVYETHEEFIGPFALTRAWRYVNDAREDNITPIIEAVQKSGIYDCTLCNACIPVCPQTIAPRQDIQMLRNKSAVMGYFDPNFTNDFNNDLSF